jgi:hypothetical protein
VPGLDGGDPLGVDVEADDRETGVGKLDRLSGRRIRVPSLP